MKANELCLRILDLTRPQWSQQYSEDKRQGMIAIDESIADFIFNGTEAERLGEACLYALGAEIRQHVAEAISSSIPEELKEKLSKRKEC